MALAAPRARLEVQPHPLLVLDLGEGSEPAQAPTLPPLLTLPPLPPGITVRVVAPEDQELDRIWAVPAVAFGHPGTAARAARPAAAAQIAPGHDGGTTAHLRERCRAGHSVH